jgi:hypothetical protein
MRITIRARTLKRVHAEAGYMLAIQPAFHRLSPCKQGESIYGFRGHHDFSFHFSLHYFSLEYRLACHRSTLSNDD